MRRYPTARMPYEPIFVKGNALSIDVAAAKRFILFTGDKDKLAGHNEYALDPRIKTGFGIGINDSAMPFENGVGTIRLLNDPTDNIWLTKIDGFGESKVLTSGYLQANNHLLVNTTNHTITEEFIVKNTNTEISPFIISAGEVTGWVASFYSGPYILESVGGEIHFKAVADGGAILIKKTLTPASVANKQFAVFKIRYVGNTPIGIYFRMRDSDGKYKTWNGARFQASTSNQIFVLPLAAPVGSIGQYATSDTGFDINKLSSMEIGLTGSTGSEYECYIDCIKFDTGTWAQVEVAVPDKLQQPTNNSSWKVYCATYRNGAYDTSINITWDYYSQLGAGAQYPVFDYAYFLDNTSNRDIYGKYKGGHIYGLGRSGDVIRSNTGFNDPNAPYMAYSSNYGTQKRIGFAILIPPSDNGRTQLNQCRLKLGIYYDKFGETTHEFSKDLNYSTGLNLIKKPFFAFYDPVGKNVEYYIITKKPIGGSYKFNETGNISNITFQLDTNTRVYRGQLKHVNLTRDSDADVIPNFLDGNEAVSIEHLIGHLNFIK